MWRLLMALVCDRLLRHAPTLMKCLGYRLAKLLDYVGHRLIKCALYTGHALALDVFRLITLSCGPNLPMLLL